MAKDTSPNRSGRMRRVVAGAFLGLSLFLSAAPFSPAAVAPEHDTETLSASPLHTVPADDLSEMNSLGIPVLPNALGDVFEDGQIDLLDLLRLRDILIQRGWPPTTYERSEGDLNRDGSLTQADLGLLRQVLLRQREVLVLLECSITALPNAGPVPLQVSFVASVSGGRPPYSYHWTFGDNSTSDEPAPTHLFSKVEAATVTLEVRDSESPSQIGGSSVTLTLGYDRMTPAQLVVGWLRAAYASTSMNLYQEMLADEFRFVFLPEDAVLVRAHEPSILDSSDSWGRTEELLWPDARFKLGSNVDVEVQILSQSPAGTPACPECYQVTADVTMRHSGGIPMSSCTAPDLQSTLSFLVRPEAGGGPRWVIVREEELSSTSGGGPCTMGRVKSYLGLRKGGLLANQAVARLRGLFAAARQYSYAHGGSDQNPQWPTSCSAFGFSGDCSSSLDFTYSMAGVVGGTMTFTATGRPDVMAGVVVSLRAAPGDTAGITAVTGL